MSQKMIYIWWSSDCIDILFRCIPSSCVPYHNEQVNSFRGVSTCAKGDKDTRTTYTLLPYSGQFDGRPRPLARITIYDELRLVVHLDGGSAPQVHLLIIIYTTTSPSPPAQVCSRIERDEPSSLTKLQGPVRWKDRRDSSMAGIFNNKHYDGSNSTIDGTGLTKTKNRI